MKKNRERENSTKMAGPRIQGIVKINRKYWKWKISQSVLIYAVCTMHLLCNVPVRNNKNDWTLKLFKL